MSFLVNDYKPSSILNEDHYIQGSGNFQNNLTKLSGHFSFRNSSCRCEEIPEIESVVPLL